MVERCPDKTEVKGPIPFGPTKKRRLVKGGVLLYNEANMAKVKVLVQGYTKVAAGQQASCPTVSLVLDKDMVMVVDPGSLPSRQILIDALAKEGFSPDQVNFVAITHSQPAHYLNVGMFPNAKVLEYSGIWNGGVVKDWQENFSNGIQILKTPGHDYSSITLFVRQDDDGVVAICGDVFLYENAPEFDTKAYDQKKLQNSREVIMKMSQWIIPGHGAMYKTSSAQISARRKIDLAAWAAKKLGIQRLGSCKKCGRAFRKITDKCVCQEFLCYRCCECEQDCQVCNCKVRRATF